MDKVQTKSWEELRAELLKKAGDADCQAFDRALAEGRKVEAVKLLRSFDIDIYNT